MDSTHSGDPVEGHTLRVVAQALSDLRLRTLSLGSLVIDQVGVAVGSLLRAAQSLAEKVLALEIDRRAFETLALRQLVAGDLRLARAISRIVVELQRASDECRKLARIAIRLHTVPPGAALAVC